MSSVQAVLESYLYAKSKEGNCVDLACSHCSIDGRMEERWLGG